jgi:hypothetical protein
MEANINACQKETIEANPGRTEMNPEMMESRVEHWEVPKEHAAVKSSGIIKKRHRGWNLAAGRRKKPEELT